MKRSSALVAFVLCSGGMLLLVARSPRNNQSLDQQVPQPAISTPSASKDSGRNSDTLPTINEQTAPKSSTPSVAQSRPEVSASPPSEEEMNLLKVQDAHAYFRALQRTRLIDAAGRTSLSPVERQEFARDRIKARILHFMKQKESSRAKG